MARTAPAADDQGVALMALYDEVLPDVYGCLLRRCGSVATAEDLRSETFIAAVDAVRDVALSLGRTVGATEVLLVRARRAFRDLHPRDDGEEG